MDSLLDGAYLREVFAVLLLPPLHELLAALLIKSKPHKHVALAPLQRAGAQGDVGVVGGEFPRTQHPHGGGGGTLLQQQITYSSLVT